MELSGLKYLVVGAGLFGAVVAERIAESLGERVLVIDRRPHLGGSAFSSPDAATGIEVHRYGTHVFHTDDSAVWEYVTHFGRFNHYRHRVWTRHGDRTYALPLGLATVNAFYGRDFSPSEAQAFVTEEAARSGGGAQSANLEDAALARMGRPLYEAFVQSYTRKQWGREPRDLPASILAHFELRCNYQSDYFLEPWQGVPVEGYGELFRVLLRHSRIEVRTGVRFRDLREQVPADCRIIYSGGLDELFDYELGSLAWRGLRFETQTVAQSDLQGMAVLNYSDAGVPYTRVHEFKHLQVHRPDLLNLPQTVVAHEFALPVAQENDAFYPVNDAYNNSLYQAYRTLARERYPLLLPGGRLGAYSYWNMSETIHNALECFRSGVARCRHPLAQVY